MRLLSRRCNRHRPPQRLSAPRAGARQIGESQISECRTKRLETTTQLQSNEAMYVDVIPTAELRLDLIVLEPKWLRTVMMMVMVAMVMMMI